MTMRIKYGVLVLALMLLSQCGKPSQSPGTDDNPVDPPAPPPDKAKVTLMLFGAPPCKYCKSVFPKINELLKDELKARDLKLKAELWVTTGGRWSDPPTQESANQYRVLLKVDFQAKPDEWPKKNVWKNYRKYIDDSQVLPAVAVLDETGEKIKAFLAGQFTAEEVANYVKNKIVAVR